MGSLYDQLKDKSKIRLQRKVLGISHEGDGVAVRCQDGSEFRGDLVIGADGIHSRTRGEMQNFAEETGPEGLMDEDKSSKLQQHKRLAATIRLRKGFLEIVASAAF